MNAAVARTFDSFRVPNYRRFFAGQVVSWTGTWVQWVAQAWLVLRLTHSGFGLGLVTALQWSPILFFGAWAGVLADRVDKRKLLIVTNTTSGVLALILGVLTVSGDVALWMVITVAFLLGLVMAVDNPTRQTFTLEMVGRERLTNAISLNVASFTTARVIGPAVAGFMIAGIGIGQCFIVDALSFVPVTLALLTMDRDALNPQPAAEQSRGQVREGLRYVRSVPVLRTLLTVMAIIGLLEYNWQIILPILAKQTFSGDAKTLGLLGAVLGLGMIGGALANAAFGRPSRKLLIGSAVVLGIVTLFIAAAPTIVIAGALMIPLGAASMAFIATMNSTLQLNSSDEMRGRVMALYFVLFLGSTPIGGPIVGWISETFDPRAALVLGGVATLLACVYGYFKLPAHLHSEDEAEKRSTITATPLHERV